LVPSNLVRREALNFEDFDSPAVSSRRSWRSFDIPDLVALLVLLPRRRNWKSIFDEETGIEFARRRHRNQLTRRRNRVERGQTPKHIFVAVVVDFIFEWGNQSVHLAPACHGGVHERHDDVFAAVLRHNIRSPPVEFVDEVEDVVDARLLGFHQL